MHFKSRTIYTTMLKMTPVVLTSLIATAHMSHAHAADNTDTNQNITTQQTTDNKAAANNPNIYANEHVRKVSLALVSAAEHTNYKYDETFTAPPENIQDERGLTAGLIGFTTNGDDMKQFINEYNDINPNNPMKGYTEAIHNVSGTDETEGLEGAEDAWNEAAANDRENMIKAQKRVIDKDYMQIAEKRAEEDGLQSNLSRYIYFDAIVKHGPGRNEQAPKREWSFDDLRAEASKDAKTPANGGDEKAYLKNFVGKRYDATEAENKYLKEHDPDFDSANTTDRLDTQMRLLDNNNMGLDLPLKYQINDDYEKSLTSKQINELSSEDANFDGIWN